MSRKELLGSMTYFDILAGLAALALASICLTLAVSDRPGWIWNDKDTLGLGLLLGTMLAFLLLRRHVPAQSLPWLRAGLAAATVAAGVVLFRRWSSMWIGGWAMLLLFGLCLQSKTASEGLTREDLFRVLLVVGSLLVSALLAEGTLRLFPALLSEYARARVLHQAALVEPWHVAHPSIGHLHNIAYLRRLKTSPRAHFLRPARFDAWGFRNTEPWPARVDILTVGDSWTYSLPVTDAQAWPALLERELAPRCLLNLGLIGAAPQQYLRVYETFGAKVAPQVLLVGLFLGNDLEGALGFDAWVRAGSPGNNYTEFWMEEVRKSVRGWQYQSSYLSLLLQDLQLSYHAGAFVRRNTVRLADGSRMQLAPRLLARQAPLAVPGQPAFTLVLHTLAHLCTLATQQQTHCLVLLFPSKEEVYLPVLGAAAVDLAAPLRPELEKRGIAYLDLGPPFRQRAAAGEALFGEADSHPNVPGYALIAQVVLAYLQEHAARYGLD